MSAIRLARGFTGRSKVVKFAGCYHGHVDSLLAAAGLRRRDPRPARHARASPARRRPTRSCCPTTTSPRSRRRSRRTAARSPASSPRRPPATWASCRRCPASTPGLAELCREHGALLISDEVMTGFRVQPGRLVRPRGRAARPDDVRQGHGRRLPGRGVRRPRRRDGAARAGRPRLPGGTLSGNPVATAAGLATLRACHRRGLRARGQGRRRGRAAGRRRAGRRGRRAPGAARRATCSRSSSRRTRSATTPARGARRRSATPRSSTRCSPRRLPAAVGVRGLVPLRRARRRGARRVADALPARRPGRRGGRPEEGRDR